MIQKKPFMVGASIFVPENIETKQCEV